MRPPTRSRASSTETPSPLAARSAAALRPAAPAPITITSMIPKFRATSTLLRRLAPRSPSTSGSGPPRLGAVAERALRKQGRQSRAQFFLRLHKLSAELSFGRFAVFRVRTGCAGIWREDDLAAALFLGDSLLHDVRRGVARFGLVAVGLLDLDAALLFRFAEAHVAFEPWGNGFDERVLQHLSDDLPHAVGRVVPGARVVDPSGEAILGMVAEDLGRHADQHPPDPLQEVFVLLFPVRNLELGDQRLHIAGEFPFSRCQLGIDVEPARSETESAIRR